MLAAAVHMLHMRALQPHCNRTSQGSSLHILYLLDIHFHHIPVANCQQATFIVFVVSCVWAAGFQLCHIWIRIFMGSLITPTLEYADLVAAGTCAVCACI
jgi:hypothetical protein